MSTIGACDSAGATPSVVQIRTQDLLSDTAVSIVAKTLEAHRDDIERGALLSIDDGGTGVKDATSQALAGPLAAIPHASVTAIENHTHAAGARGRMSNARSAPHERSCVQESPRMTVRVRG